MVLSFVTISGKGKDTFCWSHQPIQYMKFPNSGPSLIVDISNFLCCLSFLPWSVGFFYRHWPQALALRKGDWALVASHQTVGTPCAVRETRSLQPFCFLFVLAHYPINLGNHHIYGEMNPLCIDPIKIAHVHFSRAYFDRGVAQPPWQWDLSNLGSSTIGSFTMRTNASIFGGFLRWRIPKTMGI